MDQYQINWDTLVRYINGTSTQQEERRIREWLDSDPKHEEFLIFFKKIWDSSTGKRHQWDVDAAWSRFNDQYKLFQDREDLQAQTDTGEEKDRTRNDLTSAGSSPSGNPVKPFRDQVSAVPSKLNRKSGWYSWSAVAALCLAVVFASLYSFDPGAVEEESAESPVIREIMTNHGQRTHLNLSDGSRVILNAGSVLTVPETFPQGEPREVHLSGEAYFEVARDTSRSFTVHTEDALTRVLGTRFQVMSYPDEDEMEVVVADGKVALQGRNQPANQASTIEKNQMGFLLPDGRAVVSDVKNLSVYLGWTEGELIFDGEPLTRAVVRLERWYGINIQIDSGQPDLSERELTAEFNERQPVDEVLEAIALTLDISYSKQEGTSNFRLFKS